MHDCLLISFQRGISLTPFQVDQCEVPSQRSPSTPRWKSFAILTLHERFTCWNIWEKQEK